MVETVVFYRAMKSEYILYREIIKIKIIITIIIIIIIVKIIHIIYW